MILWDFPEEAIKSLSQKSENGKNKVVKIYYIHPPTPYIKLRANTSYAVNRNISQDRGKTEAYYIALRKQGFTHLFQKFPFSWIL